MSSDWVQVKNFSTEELEKLSIPDLRKLAGQECIEVLDLSMSDPRIQEKLIWRIQRAYE